VRIANNGNWKTNSKNVERNRLNTSKLFYATIVQSSRWFDLYRLVGTRVAESLTPCAAIMQPGFDDVTATLDGSLAVAIEMSIDALKSVRRLVFLGQGIVEGEV
jgi:hypothetical protein